MQFQATTSTSFYEKDGVEVKERLPFMVPRTLLFRRTLQRPPLIPPRDYKIGVHIFRLLIHPEDSEYTEPETLE